MRSCVLCCCLCGPRSVCMGEGWRGLDRGAKGRSEGALCPLRAQLTSPGPPRLGTRLTWAGPARRRPRAKPRTCQELCWGRCPLPRAINHPEKLPVSWRAPPPPAHPARTREHACTRVLRAQTHTTRRHTRHAWTPSHMTRTQTRTRTYHTQEHTLHTGSACIHITHPHHTHTNHTQAHRFHTPHNRLHTHTICVHMCTYMPAHWATHLLTRCLPGAFHPHPKLGWVGGDR